MNCLKNMERITLTTDIVMDMIKLYQYKGKEFYYKEALENDLDTISKQAIQKETSFFQELFDLKISDSRKKLIITKGASVKNKDEQMLLNIRGVFSSLHENDIVNCDLNWALIEEMAKFLFRDVKDIKFDSYQEDVKKGPITNKRKANKRDDLENLIEMYLKMLESGDYELTLLVTNFYVDFINIKPFTSDNDVIGLLVLYMVLFREGFELFRFTSFFEEFVPKKESFQKAVLQANFNWEDGYSQTNPLHRLVIRLLLNNYNKVEQLLRDYEFDSSLNKSDNIENTINKLGELFTKDDIRTRHPFVSLSTINRTLQRLRDQNVIRPLGVGRSAKWLRVSQAPEKFNAYKQMSLFKDANEN